MRKYVMVALLPAFALGGCALFGGGGGVEPGELAARRTTPLVIPSTFTLPPPGEPASAQAR